MATRQELFWDSFMRRRVEREAKKYVAAFCQGMSVEDFRYAAENGLDILGNMLGRYLLKPGQEKSGRKKAQPYRRLVEKLASTETVIQLFMEVSPGHGRVLQQHPSWVEYQLREAMARLFGS